MTTIKNIIQALMLWLSIVTFCYCATFFMACAAIFVIPFSAIGSAVNYFNNKQRTTL